MRFVDVIIVACDWWWHWMVFNTVLILTLTSFVIVLVVISSSFQLVAFPFLLLEPFLVLGFLFLSWFWISIGLKFQTPDLRKKKGENWIWCFSDSSLVILLIDRFLLSVLRCPFKIKLCFCLGLLISCDVRLEPIILKRNIMPDIRSGMESSLSVP